MKDNWYLISYLFRSQNRQKVLQALKRNPKTPKQLDELTNIRINHISNILKELLEKELVKCLNPSDKKGRFYEITEMGLEILNFLENT